MKILLCFAFVCAMAIAKPMDEAEKLTSTLLSAAKPETANNNRVESIKDQISTLVPFLSESGEKERKIESNDGLKNANDDKLKISYTSAINNQANPHAYSSQLTSIHNTNPSFPSRSIASTYPSRSYGLGPGTYGLGSGSYELGTGSYGVRSGRYVLGSGSGSYGVGSEPYVLGSYGIGSGSYGLESGSYGLGLGSYGVGLGSYGVGLKSYRLGSKMYGLESGSYGVGSGTYGSESGSNGLGSGSYGLLESQGLGVSSYPSSLYGLGSGSFGLSGPSELFSSSLPVDIPTSYSSAAPYREGINVAQQIIHQPIITELQEVIHKPIITEVQEVVNKPVISEVQQVIHKPLYTEHIDLGPSYHGYQKHIVKQPIYHKPTTNFVHQPMAHTGTIHLADEYEHAVNTPTTTQNVCPTGIGSSYGFTGVPFQATYESEIDGIHQNAQYEPAYSVPNVVSYEPRCLSSKSTPVPVGQSSPKYAVLASVDYSSTPYRYIIGSSKQQIARSNTGDEESHRNIDETSQPNAAEQITYDEFQSYTQQPNDNQRFNDNQIQRQQGKNSEDHKQIKMDMDAIAKNLEKNPETRKQLIKIITESIGDQMTEDQKKTT